eukprot:4904730-Pleurochrysis_carterae.AAC.1
MAALVPAFFRSHGLLTRARVRFLRDGGRPLLLPQRHLLRRAQLLFVGLRGEVKRRLRERRVRGAFVSSGRAFEEHALANAAALARLPASSHVSEVSILCARLRSRPVRARAPRP